MGAGEGLETWALLGPTHRLAAVMEGRQALLCAGGEAPGGRDYEEHWRPQKSHVPVLRWRRGDLGGHGELEGGCWVPPAAMGTQGCSRCHPRHCTHWARAAPPKPVLDQGRTPKRAPVGAVDRVTPEGASLPQGASQHRPDECLGSQAGIHSPQHGHGGAQQHPAVFWQPHSCPRPCCGAVLCCAGRQP